MTTDLFLSPIAPLAIAAAATVALGASLLGTFMILRRMALVADAFSHVALPGIAAGLLMHFSPAIGALALLVCGVVIMEHLESDRHIHPETTLGVLFTAALAIGAVLIPDHELLESLFGDISKLERTGALFALAGGALLAIITFIKARDFALLTLSPEMAHASGVPVRRTRLLFFFSIALAVSLGIQFMGVLLVGALVIMPAAIAKNFAPNLRALFLFAGVIAVIAVFIGLTLAHTLGWLPGPTVALVLSALFACSLLMPHT